MRKVIAGAGLAGVMAFGGLTVAAVNPMSIAGGAPSASAPTSTAGATNQSPPSPSPPRSATREGPLAKALAGLVANKTITQAQADAVTKAVRTEVGELRKEHPGRIRHHLARGVRRGVLDVAAEQIGVTREQLAAGLRDGKSIAAQAEAKGVDPAKVEQALVAAGTKRIDDALAADKIDADQAAELKAQLSERVKSLMERAPKRHG